MGSFANTLFTVMLSWFRGIVSAVWAAFSSEQGGNLIQWVGNHWILLVALLCIIGLTADLAVYIFRWKPYRVWKSFFTRKKSNPSPQEENQTNRFEPEDESVDEGYRRLFKDGSIPEDSAGTAPPPAQKPTLSGILPVSGGNERERDDFSRWISENKEPEASVPDQSEVTETVTSAGYHVPADSPYRRPREMKDTAGTISDTAAEHEEEPASDEPVPVSGRQEGLPIRPMRRRRILVAELFSDPEEDLQEFEAPQQLIDSRQAYHEPIYPRGWKKNEDNAE